jgi:hypothetical protein
MMEAKKVTTTTAAEGRLGMELSYGERLWGLLEDFEAATAAEMLPRSEATTTSKTVTTTMVGPAVVAPPPALTTTAAEAEVGWGNLVINYVDLLDLLLGHQHRPNHRPKHKLHRLRKRHGPQKRRRLRRRWRRPRQRRL